jgi:hypothetical protein
MLRDDRNEEGAVPDLLTNGVIPGVTAPKLALVEPNLDTRIPERIANPSSSLGILRGVAKEDSLRRLVQG